MKKLSYFAIIVCTIFLFVLPGSCLAKMTKMTDSELEQATAQAGFSDILDVLAINHDEETGSYYFGSEEEGYISLADVSYDGYHKIHSDVTTSEYTAENGNKIIECEFDGNIIDVSNFSSTIRMGSEKNTGDSFGTVNIGHMTLSLHGTVRITAD